MTEFRFPHPYDNVKQAIDKAEDGLTGSLSNLAVQLLDENNRAVEDAINSGASGGAVAFGTLREGAGEFTATTPTLENGVWLIQGNAECGFDVGDPGQIEAEIKDGDGGVISGPHQSIVGVAVGVYIPAYRYTSDGTDVAVITGTVISGTPTDTVGVVVSAMYLGSVAE